MSYHKTQPTVTFFFPHSLPLCGVDKFVLCQLLLAWAGDAPSHCLLTWSHVLPIETWKTRLLSARHDNLWHSAVIPSQQVQHCSVWSSYSDLRFKIHCACASVRSWRRTLATIYLWSISCLDWLQITGLSNFLLRLSAKHECKLVLTENGLCLVNLQWTDTDTDSGKSHVIQCKKRFFFYRWKRKSQFGSRLIFKLCCPLPSHV